MGIFIFYTIMKVPFACCMMNGDFPEFTDIQDDNCLSSDSPLTGPTSDNSYIDRNCWNELNNKIAEYETAAIVVAVVCIIFLFVLFLMTIYVILHNKKGGNRIGAA